MNHLYMRGVFDFIFYACWNLCISGFSSHHLEFTISASMACDFYQLRWLAHLKIISSSRKGLATSWDMCTSGLVSCLEVEMKLFEVLRPPSWISYFQFGRTWFLLNSWSSKTLLPLKFRSYHVCRLKNKYLEATILDFRYTVWSYIILFSFLR